MSKENINELEMKRAELLEMTEGLNERGIDCLLFLAGEYLKEEKYQASTSPERLQEIHDKEVRGVSDRAADANSRYDRPGIFSKIGKRADYLKVLDKSSPYYKDFFDIFNSPIDDIRIWALDFFALGCIATERDMKQKSKRTKNAAGVK